MPTTDTDQFYSFDPANPPPAGTAVSFSVLSYTDENDDGDLDRFNNDSVNGSDITNSWPGDTVTINVPGVGNVTYTGITFYLANGDRVFTPTDGQVLQDGTFVSATFVTTQGPGFLNTFGPPCFVRGTLISTPSGPRRVEEISQGDLVITEDHGPQQVRWIGCRKVEALGELAPVRFEAGTIGNQQPLELSPCHAVAMASQEIEMNFGEKEVLARAAHLANGETVRRMPAREVEYFHLLFDRHEVIFANGAKVESLFPGDWLLCQDPNLAAELSGFADKLDFQNWKTARLVLRQFEVRALRDPIPDQRKLIAAE